MAKAKSSPNHINTPPPDVENREFTRLLKVRLPPDEVAKQAQELADKEITLHKVREEKKAANQGFNTRIKDLNGAVKELADTVHTMLRETEVPVVGTYNYVQGTVRIVRRDNSEVIEDRTMTIEERQRNLPLPEEPAPLSN